ncbi:MAG: TIGR01458 family HAD-type hydrolase [Candidatus Marinimicrobia bacterium]|nr:TIGR01458 family HAD-type hydrolase [Candidatus Neomarinimicrobiota bacterium]
MAKDRSMTQKGFLFDLDGVFYISGGLIPGGIEAIVLLREKNIPFRLLTNTTTKTRKQLSKKLNKLGLKVEENEIVSAGQAGVIYLNSLGSPKCHLLISDDLKEDYADFDCGNEVPKWVVMGDRGHDWTYDDMNVAFRLMMDGADLLALHKGKYFQVKDGLNMDIGAIVTGLEYATGKKATTLGKPNKEFFQAALDDLGCSSKDVIMVGDDLINDIGGAQALGIKSVLVKTGKYRKEILEKSDIIPDAIIDSIADLEHPF